MSLKSINQHAWGLWAALTSPSGHSYGPPGNERALPIWETWFSADDVFINVPSTPGDTQTTSRAFEAPNQNTHVRFAGTPGQDNPDEMERTYYQLT